MFSFFNKFNQTSHDQLGLNVMKKWLKYHLKTNHNIGLFSQIAEKLKEFRILLLV